MQEFDRDATIEALFERVQALLQNDKEYLSLLAILSEKGKYSDAISKHIFGLSKKDQLTLLRPVVEGVLVAEALCKKYGISLDDNTEDIGGET